MTNTEIQAEALRLTVEIDAVMLEWDLDRAGRCFRGAGQLFLSPEIVAAVPGSDIESYAHAAQETLTPILMLVLDGKHREALVLVRELLVSLGQLAGES